MACIFDTIAPLLALPKVYVFQSTVGACQVWMCGCKPAKTYMYTVACKCIHLLI